MTSCCHGGNNERVEGAVQLIRRHDQTWPHVPDLIAAGRVEHDKINVAPPYITHSHIHSDTSKSVGDGSSIRPSSLRACICAAASAHPSRVCVLRSISSPVATTRSSTSSPSLASSISGFGSRIPRELPIFTIRAFIDVTLHFVVITLYTLRCFRQAKCAHVPESIGNVPHRVCRYKRREESLIP